MSDRNVPAEPESVLAGLAVLLVEDEFLVACELADFLADHGANVLGPAPSVEAALKLIDRHGRRLDGAVLDVNLRGERSFPAADALALLGVPFVFVTGYDPGAMPGRYSSSPHCLKPIDKPVLLRILARAVEEASRRGLP